MKKINIVSLSFDMKTKIIMIISIIIASIIISYSFYNICIKNIIATDVEVDKEYDFTTINAYEADYNVIVNSNKNTNTYNVIEMVDLANKSYYYLIDNSLKISIKEDELKISKENIAYEYSTKSSLPIESNNFISFSSIIDVIKKINSNELSGNIKRVEVNNTIVCKIHIDEEYIKKISDIEIIMSQNQNEISEIKMYDNSDKEMYYFSFNEFKVKK